MLKLLKTEWLKVKHYNAFIILSVFFALGVFTANYIVYTVNKEIVGQVNTGGLVPAFSPYNFDKTWHTTSYVTGWLLILPALLLIILVTNEFTYRTNRQNVIDGWSRKEFIDVKIAWAILFSIVSTILVIITALTFGFASGTSFSWEGIPQIGYFLVKALTYNLLAVLISVWVKRTGFAIGIYFIYLGAENIISQLLVVGSLKLKKEYGFDPGNMGDYLPMNAADGLLTFPKNPIQSLASSALPTDYTGLVVGMAIFYLVLFFALSRRRYIRMDL